MRTSPVWNPQQYNKYADERGRPFADLVARIRLDEAADQADAAELAEAVAAGGERAKRAQPAGQEDAASRATTPFSGAGGGDQAAGLLVVDLGCGPGNLTSTLLDRWPTATVHGVDSSQEMIDEAQPLATDRLTFEVGDLREWTAEPGSIDVIVTNATLQWIPEQLDLLPRFVRALKPGGWLAIQIPGNGNAPSHAILRELAATDPYAEYAKDKSLRPDVPGPAEYVAALSAEGCTVDAWETTYSHVLEGENAVLEWVKGTGARPVLQSLPDDLRERFEAEYGARLNEAYPRKEFGTVLPFRRIFAVARKDS